MDELKRTEITLLEIDFEDNITCDILRGTSRCSNLALARIYSVCACGNRNRVFACEEHILILTQGNAICGACGNPRGITEYC